MAQRKQNTLLIDPIYFCPPTQSKALVADCKKQKGQPTLTMVHQSGWLKTLLFISSLRGTVCVPWLASDC
jgi:hypothetical protein